MERKERKKKVKKVLFRHFWILVILGIAFDIIGGDNELQVLRRAAGKLYASIQQGDLYGGIKDVYYDRVFVAEREDTFLSAHGEWIEEQLKKAASEKDGREYSESYYEALLKVYEEKKEQAIPETSVLGRSEGVFAEIVNGITQGTFLTTIIKGIKSMTGSGNVAVFLFIFVSLGAAFLLWYLFANVMSVIRARIFLESLTYERVPMSRVLFLLRNRKWLNVSKVMCVEYFLLLAWSFTLIGGVIKKYSYYLVPYIAAENPEVSPREAIDLSRKMMNGHKMECFICELSFLPWGILNFITFGISGILFSSPYKKCFFADYYRGLREAAIADDMDEMEILNDRYLYEFAEDGRLQDAYAEAAEIENEALTDPISESKGLKSFLVRNFGISLFSKEADARYEEVQIKKLKLDMYKHILGKRMYPGRLSPIPEKEKHPRIETVNYLRTYSVLHIILFFFTFSLAGWLWEVGIHLVEDGVFVNRGVLHGPWLPIYGFGGVFILVLLTRFRKKPWQEFIMAILLCGVVEYFTSFYLEKAKDGTKWWDYTGYFINLNGRISAEGLLVFGIAGIAMVYYAAPLLDDLYRRLNRKFVAVLCVVLLLIFTADNIYSSKNPNTGAGITDYAVTYDGENSSCLNG